MHARSNLRHAEGSPSGFLGLQEAADKLEEAMLERLNDKVAGVRLQAARVLQRLARPDEVHSSSERLDKTPFSSPLTIVVRSICRTLLP